MKRTIDSYFQVTATGSSQKSKEKTSSLLWVQITELEKLEQIENDSLILPKPNLNSIKSSDRKERHYNIQWKQKHKWLVYNEEKKGAFCKLC